MYGFAGRDKLRKAGPRSLKLKVYCITMRQSCDVD